MAIPEQVVDSTFDAWWKQFGRTQANIPKALERTKQQLGGAMPPRYTPPPQRNRSGHSDGPHTLSGEAPVPECPPLHEGETRMPDAKDPWKEELLKFLRGGKSEPVEGIFLPNALDKDSELALRGALESFLRHSQLGISRADRELDGLVTEQERMWLHPQLVEQLRQQPCLKDREKQAARDEQIFRKFWNLDKPQVNMDWDGIRRKRVLEYLDDMKYMSQNPIGAGFYGLRRMVNDHGHQDAMRYGVLGQSLFNMANQHGKANRQNRVDWKQFGSRNQADPFHFSEPQTTPSSPFSTRPPSTYGFELQERSNLPRSW